MKKASKCFTEFISAFTSFFELFNVNIVAGWGSQLFYSNFEVFKWYEERIYLRNLFELFLQDCFEFRFWAKLYKHSENVRGAIPAWILSQFSLWFTELTLFFWLKLFIFFLLLRIRYYHLLKICFFLLMEVLWGQLNIKWTF